MFVSYLVYGIFVRADLKNLRTRKPLFTGLIKQENFHLNPASLYSEAKQSKEKQQSPLIRLGVKLRPPDFPVTEDKFISQSKEP